VADRTIYEIGAAAGVAYHTPHTPFTDEEVASSIAGSASHGPFRAVVEAVVRETLAEVERQLMAVHELFPATEDALADARTALIGGEGGH
jgi:hypothetical protein